MTPVLLILSAVSEPHTLDTLRHQVPRWFVWLLRGLGDDPLVCANSAGANVRSDSP